MAPDVARRGARGLLLLLGLVVVVGCAKKRVAVLPPPEPEAAARVPATTLPVLPPPMPTTAFNEYVIGPGDLLEIDVFELEELSRKVRVNGRGAISYPMLGVIEVGGLTKLQLEEKLRGLLSQRYVRNPQVTVFLSEMRSGSVAVLGAVQKPGAIELLVSRTVLDALSQAGGITKDAGKRAFVIRAGQRTAPDFVDLERLMEGADLSYNHPVLPGDVVFVPQAKKYKVFVYGEVEDAGELEIEEGDDVTVLQAVAMAGGLTRRAKGSKVKIVRQAAEATGRPQQLKINLDKVIAGKTSDLTLQEGDIVVVPKSFF